MCVNCAVKTLRCARRTLSSVIRLSYYRKRNENEIFAGNSTLRAQSRVMSSLPRSNQSRRQRVIQFLIIDRGYNDGVRVGLPVVTADGLVGRISEVSRLGQVNVTNRFIELG